MSCRLLYIVCSSSKLHVKLLKNYLFYIHTMDRARIILKHVNNYVRVYLLCVAFLTISRSCTDSPKVVTWV